MNTKRLCAMLVLLAALASGCTAPPAATTTSAPTPARSASPTAPAPSAASTAPAPKATTVPTTVPQGITVTDDAGRSVVVPSAPQRIVSLAPSTTEIAFALGLGGRMVAVDTFSDYPADAKTLNKINTSPLSLEQVVALKPDLVLAAGITSGEDIRKMANLNLTVLVVGAPSTTFENVITDIAMVGKATQTEDKAKAIVDSMKQKIDAVKAKIAEAKDKPKVYWELDATDPSKPYTPGPGSFIDDIIKMAGGTNVAANSKSAYVQVNAEEIVAANPDVIILSDFAYGTTVESVKGRPGWSAISAVKNDKVFPIDDNLVSRPGPRLAIGYEAAARLVHPELFK